MKNFITLCPYLQIIIIIKKQCDNFYRTAWACRQSRQRSGRGDFPLSQPYPTIRIATRIVENVDSSCIARRDAHVLGFSIERGCDLSFFDSLNFSLPLSVLFPNRAESDACMISAFCNHYKTLLGETQRFAGKIRKESDEATRALTLPCNYDRIKHTARECLQNIYSRS